MIFIRDDFLKNPYEVRGSILSKKPDLLMDAERIIPGIRYYDPQTRLDDSGVNFLILDIVKKITGENVNVHHSGFHFLQEKFCEGGTHHDENTKYAAVLYLTPNPPNNSGTRIFDHKKNYSFKGKEKYLNSVKKFLLSDKNTIDKFFYKRSLKTYDRQFGKGIDIVNKFNRLVIYDAHYVHKALNFFGDRLGNCRFTYFCFMS